MNRQSVMILLVTAKHMDVPSPRALDEEAWQLDETEVELTNEAPPLHEHILQPNHFPETATRTVDEPNLAAAFIGEHPLPSPSATPVTRRLELPVVLTQRRPKARARGFVRAYAPVLDDVGIDQPTFLDFVDKLNKAVEPNPWIQAINLASLAAQNVPEPVSMAAAMACKIVADAASEVHSRKKTNAFLDTVNQEFFKPRGLVAVLIAWKPSDPSVLMDVDFSLGSKIANASPPENRSSYGKLKHRLQSSSGASSFEFPNTAPLIFPAVDELATSTSESPEAEANKQNAIKRGGNFVNDYMDRRAVAKWAGDHPESKMANAQRKPEFHSRYADPTHPASSGDLVAFVTGGKFTSGSIRDGGLGRQSISDGRIGAFEARGTGQRGFGRGSILDGRVAALQARGFSREAGEYAGPGAETSRRRQSEALAPGAPGEDARSRQQQIPVEARHWKRRDGGYRLRAAVAGGPHQETSTECK